MVNLLSQTLPKQPAPNYEATLQDFSKFPWSSIGVKVEKEDKYGPTIVGWQGKLYQRRSPQNAYGAVIFFSRCTGKDENNNNKYERLITFKPASEFQVQPISRQAEGYIQ